MNSDSNNESCEVEKTIEPYPLYKRSHPDWLAASISTFYFCMLFVLVCPFNLMFATLVFSLFTSEKSFLFQSGILCGGTVPTIIFAYCIAKKAYFNTKWKPFDPSLQVCHVCEYDLTGNMSGVCPECGTAVVGREPAAAKVDV